MDILGKLFSSEALVKIMRLFLMNPLEVFDSGEISRRAKTNKRKVGHEINLLKAAGFIRPGTKQIEVFFKKNKKTKVKKVKGWVLNSDFALLNQLRNLILNQAPIARDKLLGKFRSLGSRLKLVVLSGVFADDLGARTDVLIVGDSISRARLEKVLGSVESSIGKELNYAYFTTEEFLYRMSMYDQFIREILESPHEKILNKLNI